MLSLIYSLYTANYVASYQENSRIFAGKQIHPFFSSWKAGKKDLETTEVENNGCLEKTKERNVELGPVHVFDTAKVCWLVLLDELF